MKSLALFLTTLAVAAATIEWTDLVMTYMDPSDDPEHLKSFFGEPRTVADAIAQGWVELTGLNKTWVTMYCLPDDPRVALLFDSYGNIAGFQVAFPVSDMESIQIYYNMSNIPEYTIKTIFDEDWWTLTAYVQGPDVIANGGRSSTWDNLTGTGGVWFDNGDEGYIYGPRNKSEISDVDYDWVDAGVCIPAMGVHVYYAMTETLACENIHPWYLMYIGDELTSIGLTQFGGPSTLTQQWWEPIVRSLYKTADPNGPDCLFTLIDKIGLIGFHIYFTPEPWNITCS